MNQKNDSQRIRYGRCPYSVDNGEALLIEVAKPRNNGWNFGAFNIWSDVGDIQNRQTSLNAGQGRIDGDDILRVVVSSEDLGHPNWLDTSGNRRGQVWYRTFDQPEAIESPLCRVIPAQDLWKHIPADTPRIDAEERRRRLLERRHHVARRYQR